MFKLSTALLGLMLLSTSALAQMYFGPGDKSCGSWTTDHRGNVTIGAAYDMWVLGFLSGINTSETLGLNRPDLLKGTDPKGVRVWMDNYCASHPLDSVMTAVINLIGELRKKID
jgi:hypothetical protein